MSKWDKYEVPAEGASKWDKYEVKEAPSKLESGLRGVAQGASLGFSDEITGGLEAAYDTAFGDRKFEELPGTYKLRRDESRKAYGEAEKANPKTYFAGELGGGIASALAVPGASAVKGAAALGAASGLGYSDEDSALGIAKDTAIGGALGGALAKVAPKLVQVAQSKGAAGQKWLSDTLKSFANKQAVKSLGGTKGQIQALGDKVDDVGTMLLEEKIVTPLASSREIADRVGAQGERLASETVPIYNKAQSSDTSTRALLDEIDNKIASLRSNPGKAPIISKLERYKQDLGDAGQVAFNPDELRKYRQAVDRTINFNSDAPSQLASKEMRGLIREKEMSAIEKIDPALRNENEKLFKNIHLNRLAEDLAESGAARSAANNEIGMNTWNAGTQAAAAGASGGTSTIAMAIRELTRRYGNQMTAVGVNKLANAMQNGKFASAFQRAAKDGPMAVAAVHQALLGNPEYRKEIGEE